MTLLEAPQNSKADPDAGGELDDAIRRDIIADLHRLSRFRGWSVIDTALGTLDEEQPVENLAPAVDIYRDSLIVIQARNGQQRRLYVPELWRVGSCWKIVGLRLEDVPGRPPQRRTQKVSDVSTHVSAEKFWEAYTLGDIEASLARRWQMFWRRSSEPTSFFRTSLAELRDRKARLTGLKAAVDEVLRRWSREPDRVWDRYDRGSPSWLFTAISGFEPKSYAEASAWWSVNRDRVILDGTGNALTVTSP